MAPNISIILPGSCQASCSFCFWKENMDVVLPDSITYLRTVEDILASLPESFYQISITGGEPGISPYLVDVLRLIDRNKYRKIVFTTNGINLADIAPILTNDLTKISHLNVSRHSFRRIENEAVFGVNLPEIKSTIRELNRFGIDTNFNCVLTEYLQTEKDIYEFIAWAKTECASSICFRNPEDTILPSKQECMFKSYRILEETTCPVCVSRTQLIDGLLVTWKSAKSEPTTTMPEMIYEVVIHPDGRATSDWGGKYPIFEGETNEPPA